MVAFGVNSGGIVGRVIEVLFNRACNAVVTDNRFGFDDGLLRGIACGN